VNRLEGISNNNSNPLTAICWDAVMLLTYSPTSVEERREERVCPHHHINFSAFGLACPSLPTMMWSCTAIPSGPATSMMAWVIWMSARARGVGSPEG
jgi:hypothetical protein